MQIIDVPVGSIGEVIVSEANDSVSIELKATVLGTPEDCVLNFPLPVLLGLIMNSITSPVVKAALGWIITLLHL